MEIKLFDSELKVMEILWREGDLTAKRIAELTKEQIGWSKTTTYTIIKKCIEKDIVKRSEPNFVCQALITREQVQQYETSELINKFYNGATDKLIASIIEKKRLSKDEIEHLKELINRLE